MATHQHDTAAAVGSVTPTSDNARRQPGVREQEKRAGHDSKEFAGLAAMRAIGMAADSMLTELRRLCPGIWARPLREFDATYSEGVWTHIDSAHVMPDGLPMLDPFANGSAGYNGPIHTGFEAWLAARGWWIENYDGATFLLLPERVTT